MLEVYHVNMTANLVGLCGHSSSIFCCEAPEKRLGCIVEKGVMNKTPKSLLRSFSRRDTVPWSQMGVLLPIDRIRFRAVQALDVPFLILMGDWGTIGESILLTPLLQKSSIIYVGI